MYIYGVNLCFQFVFATAAATAAVKTHWGRVTHIGFSKLTIIGPDNGLSPGRRQAIIWTNAGILSIGPLGTNFSENLIGIQTFSFKKMPLKMSSTKWCPFCLGLNVLTTRLFLLPSRPLVLNLTNVGQNRCGAKHSMTFAWLWLKVTAVVVITKNVLSAQ